MGVTTRTGLFRRTRMVRTRRGHWRCVVRVGTLRTPRSWPGLLSIAPYTRSNATAAMGQFTDGDRFASGFTPMYARMVSIRAKYLHPLLRFARAGREFADDSARWLSSRVRPRVMGTVAAIERELMWEGFVRRYSMTSRTEDIDGLPAGEGAFVACTCWLADNHLLQGRADDARESFERVLAIRNVGLLSEEYDPGIGRLLGNFPQPFLMCRW